MTALACLTSHLYGETPKHSFSINSGGSVIISDVDLVQYGFAEHALKIRGESVTRLAKLGEKPPVSGIPFQVVVDGEPVYEGRFISLLSSRTSKEPTILLDVNTNSPTAVVFIRGPYYHEPQFQTGTDPRTDPRVTQVLSTLGKLTAGFFGGANHDEALTSKTADILAECAQIKPGTTRAALMRVFVEEGGLSTPQHRTFAHRSCPYIKVDVEFKLAGANAPPVEERSTDAVAKISKPYFAWSIAD